MTDKQKEYEKVKQEVHDIIEKLGDKIPPKTAPMVEEVITKMRADNLLPKDALGFSPEVIEVIYQQGYNLFQSGKYKDALLIFTNLWQLDPTNSRYPFAIAACYHYSKDYLNAAANYIFYKYMDPLNPIPCFHLYDCYVKINEPISALYEIQEALVLSDKNPRYAQLKEKIQLEFIHFKKVLRDYLKDKYELKGESEPSL